MVGHFFSRGRKCKEELEGGEEDKAESFLPNLLEFCFADSLKVCDAPGGEIRGGGIVDDKLRPRFAIDPPPRSLISVIVHEPRGWTAVD